VKVHFTNAKMKTQYKVIDRMLYEMEMALRKASMVVMAKPNYDP